MAFGVMAFGYLAFGEMEFELLAIWRNVHNPENIVDSYVQNMQHKIKINENDKAGDTKLICQTDVFIIKLQI